MLKAIKKAIRFACHWGRLRSFSLACWVMAYEDAEEVH
jgi:hypothetical protein